MFNEGDEVAAVRTRALTRIFKSSQGTVKALDSLDMDVQAGFMSALVGPDGAGKTTLMRIICGLLVPSSGSIAVLGQNPAVHARRVQDRISYMPQRFSLYEDLSVSENMELYADLHGLPRKERRARFSRLLDLTDLSRFSTRIAGKLSGGMKQKLALACSLVRSPDLLLLDEPTVGVDPLSRRDLWDIIAQMVQEERISVLVSTSSMNEAERCKSVFVLHEGHILAQGTPEALRAITRGLCRVLPLPGSVPARRVQAWLLDHRDLVLDAVPEGRDVRFLLTAENKEEKLNALLPSRGFGPVRTVEPRLEDSFMFLLKRHGEARNPARSWPPMESNTEKTVPEIVIEVRDLVRKFGAFTAVNKLSFSVRRGEVFGLLGPNGAGKTTTFRMLCGLLPATAGSLRVVGEDLRRAAAQARSRIGYVSQKFSLYANLSVLENLRFFGGVYGIRPAILRRRIADILEKFDLKGYEHELSDSLPGGFKQRLAMAAALLHEPEILFLDEPTSGIDPLARRLFWRRITALADAGTTVIVTTHFMEEAEYCDRMLIQDAGTVLALGTPSEIRTQAGNAATMDDAFIHIVEQARKRGHP